MAVVWTTELTELSQKICNTGVIEDLERIWLHPPRNGDFKILSILRFLKFVFL